VDASSVFVAGADVVVALHFGVVAFVTFGGLFVLRWRVVMWAHVPVVLWAAAMEAFGWPCPLTVAEKWLLARAGRAAYDGGFLGHYLLKPLFGPQTPHWVEQGMAYAMALINLGVYLAILASRTRATKP